MTNYCGLRLEPVAALGVNFLENGTVYWNASRQFCYPVGAHIRHHHLETNQVQFLFPERFNTKCLEIIKLCDLAVSSNGQFLAISEVFRPNHGLLSIYDMETQVAHVHLRHDSGENQVHKFTSLCFSCDDAMIAAIGHSQKGDLRVFVWKMGRQVSLGAMFGVPSTTKSIHFDPEDPYRMIIFGEDSVASVLINTIDKDQKKIEIQGIEKFDKCAFVSAVTGLLLVTSGNKLIQIINDEVIDITEPLGDEKIDMVKSVRNLVFLMHGGLITVYRATSAVPHLVHVGVLDLHITSINEFSASPDGDLAVVLYDDSFSGLLDLNVGQKVMRQQQEAAENEALKLARKDQEEDEDDISQTQTSIDLDAQANVVEETEVHQFIGLFNPLPYRFHVGPIVAIATCPRKPLLATCGGVDKTLLVWNLAKKCVIASEKLSDPVNSCCFHPSGDLLAVGTSEKLFLYSLTFDQLVLRAKWESLSCTCVSFSNGGHFLAAGSLLIKVIATYTGKNVASLRGHNLPVKSIAWAQNDAFFVSSGLDGNVLKWSAKTWDRACEASFSGQCITAILSPSSVMDEDQNRMVATHNILVATSHSTIYDHDLKCERKPNKKGLVLTAVTLPLYFSLVSGDQRGNIQVIPYPLLPAGEDKPFHIGSEVAVHTAPVHCVMSSSDGQTLFTASEDGSIFVFNIVQPHQMTMDGPVTMSVMRGEQSFLIEKETFEERKEQLMRLREMLNLHRSQFQCAKTKLSEQHSREIVQQKNRWQMTLSSLKKQVQMLTKQKGEQEKKATEIIADSEQQHEEKIRTVKQLYEQKLTDQTKTAAELLKEKVRIQCEYEEKLHQMTEEFKSRLQERKESAQKQLEVQAIDNVEAEKEYKQIERLQDEEKLILQHEHEMEMEAFKQTFEQQIAELNGKIDAVRTDIVGLQDVYDSHIETKSTIKSAMQKTNEESHSLEREKQVCRDKINQLKAELVARGDRVAQQTNDLLDLKTKNEELQKWRTVMDYRVNEFKTQVEPKAHKIEQLREQIIDNEATLRQLKASGAKDNAQLEKMESQINGLYNEILKTENHAQKCEATITQFKHRVRAIYTELDPEKWPTEIDELVKEFVSKEEGQKEDQALTETLEEFNRHKEALSEKVLELRKKVAEDSITSGSSFLKQINKNEELITELARIRDENKKLRSDLHLAQSELNALLRQCGRESKQLETKVKTMFRSANIIQPQTQIQRRTTKTGTSMTVELF